MVRATYALSVAIAWSLRLAKARARQVASCQPTNALEKIQTGSPQATVGVGAAVNRAAVLFALKADGFMGKRFKCAWQEAERAKRKLIIFLEPHVVKQLQTPQSTTALAYQICKSSVRDVSSDTAERDGRVLDERERGNFFGGEEQEKTHSDQWQRGARSEALASAARSSHGSIDKAWLSVLKKVGRKGKMKIWSSVSSLFSVSEAGQT
ncbi:uncharacterized protein MONBRDRAFT_12627 [Monosiga brevicollis MX1]|uniref:Uncharacterized protein n=1 Tax=Monosiga brevicollis TaxID=81824 RepID=A9VCU3_MONBE|nr:uncharacterized protein MONBRDRAFT_12627 [Monosiga brevicollis MX1]EDQ84626.1 predicted protein [Monosiga brevicollis MX1]|eukprot:XP_001750530.1 hypothetical protein [Monosiga brevicollis MX1]